MTSGYKHGLDVIVNKNSQQLQTLVF